MAILPEDTWNFQGILRQLASDFLFPQQDKVSVASADDTTVSDTERSDLKDTRKPTLTLCGILS